MIKNEKPVNKLISIFVLFTLTVGMASLAKAGDGEYDALFKVERQVISDKVNADGSSEEIEELTTLVLSQLAVDSKSQADIDYNSSLESVEVIEAYTILPNGTKIPVADNAIRTVEDDISSGAAQFSDVKHKVIIFPNVSPGARTYYKVKTINHTPLFSKNYFNRFVFSPAVEYGYVEYNFSHSPKIAINVQSRGVSGGKVDSDLEGNTRYRYTYSQKNIKISEPQQVSYSDFAPAIYFSSFSNQIQFGDAYQSTAREKQEVTPTVQKLADQITKGISDPKQQAIALYNWVSLEIRYVAVYIGAGGVVPHSADSVIKNRYGDCKDHDTLLISLLKAKGIDASSALINSGTAYQVPELPVLSPFNHVITYLPKWDVYVDSTLELAPFGVLSSAEYDKPVILTALSRLSRTPRMTAENTQTVTSAFMKITSDGEVVGSSHTSFKGVDDLRARYKYSDYVTVTKEKMIKNHLAMFGETGEGKFIPTNPYNLDKPFEVDSEFKIDPVTNIPGHGALSVPVGLSAGNFKLIAFNKPKDKFNYPYICSSGYVEENYLIEFPSNVKVTDIPKNITQSVDGATYDATYTLSGNLVKIKRVAKFERPGMVCKPTDLERWKGFHKIVQKDLRSQIFYE
jgi:transglutaminase-like putative cysteine protease